MYKKLIFKTDITRKFIFFSIIPSFLIVLFFMFVIVDLQENKLKETHINLLKIIDSKVNLFLDELSTIEQIIIERKGKNKYIYDDILKFKSYLSSIILLDTNGKIKNIYSSKEFKVDKKFDYTKIIDFKTFLETKKSVLGNIYVVEETNESYIPYLFEYNGTIYILNINLTYFNDYIKTLLDADNSIQVYIVDKNGTSILNSLNSDESKQKTSFYKTPTGKATLLGNEYELIKFSEKNQTQRVTFINQRETEWKIFVKDRFDKVYNLVQTILLILGSFLILLFIFIIITAKKIAKNTVDPIESLILEIQDFANETEHQDTTNTTKSQYYIFNILIDSFEKIKEDIIDKEIELANIKEHLEEKTIQLETMNQTLKIRLQSEK